MQAFSDACIWVCGLRWTSFRSVRILLHVVSEHHLPEYRRYMTRKVGTMSLESEVAMAELGDKRLNKRLRLIVERSETHPNLSIPAAMHGRAEMEAAYRFFANENVTPEKILAPHYEMTRQRIAEHSVCLLVQDTTELNLTRPNQQMQGTGPMSSNAQFGAFVHPLMAFTPDGIPLGLVWQKTWTRDAIVTETPTNVKTRKRKETPIEDKESIRWIEGLRAAREIAEQSPETQCVLVCDSESDIYELFAEPRATTHARSLDILVRGCQDRATSERGQHILDLVRATQCRYMASVNVSSRKAKTLIETRKRQADRPARTAEVEVRSCQITLRPPYRPDRVLEPVTVNVVLVEEASPPVGEEPIQWMLITTLPIKTDEQVRAVVEYYCVRWGIEVYFKTVKSGCRVEERQFEFLDRELNALAVYMLIAWRVMLLCRLGRTCPDLDCEVMFETSEWQSVYMIVKKKDPPSTTPRLNDIIRMVASLGGYVPRSKTEPGTQTLWIGLQRMHDFANCYDSFGPPTRQPKATCVVR